MGTYITYITSMGTYITYITSMDTYITYITSMDTYITCVDSYIIKSLLPLLQYALVDDTIYVITLEYPYNVYLLHKTFSDKRHDLEAFHFHFLNRRKINKILLQVTTTTMPPRNSCGSVFPKRCCSKKKNLSVRSFVREKEGRTERV